MVPDVRERETAVGQGFGAERRGSEARGLEQRERSAVLAETDERPTQVHHPCRRQSRTDNLLGQIFGRPKTFEGRARVAETELESRPCDGATERVALGHRLEHAARIAVPPSVQKRDGTRERFLRERRRHVVESVDQLFEILLGCYRSLGDATHELSELTGTSLAHLDDAPDESVRQSRHRATDEFGRGVHAELWDVEHRRSCGERALPDHDEARPPRVRGRAETLSCARRSRSSTRMVTPRSTVCVASSACTAGAFDANISSIQTSGCPSTPRDQARRRRRTLLPEPTFPRMARVSPSASVCTASMSRAAVASVPTMGHTSAEAPSR